MISIYMFITTLATAALAKGFIECNFTDPRGQLCLGAAGQPLIFHLPKDYEIRLTKDDKHLILKKIKNNVTTVDEEYVESLGQSRSELLTRGAFNLGKVTKRHTGDYVLEVFGSNGTLLKKAKVRLEIQAPVSEPAVSQTCLSPEQREVSCSSEGDGVQFRLRLDGQLLNHTRTASTQSVAGSSAKQDNSTVSNVTISLHGQLTGTLTCNVWNNVSQHETAIHLKSCQDFTFFRVVIVAVLAAVVTVLHIVVCIKTRPTTVNEGNATDEVVYTDIRVIRNKKKTRPSSYHSAA